MRRKINLTGTEKTMLTVLLCLLVMGIGILVWLITGNREEKPDADTEPSIEIEEPAEEPVEEVEDEPSEEPEEEPKEEPKEEVLNEDQQEEVVQQNRDEGTVVEIEKVVDENETDEVTHGVDVSKYQGTINWEKVADAGVDFVMVRVGYRNMSDGKIVADSNAKYNMQEAQKQGIKVGAYFFSTAIDEAEAVEEANWVADYIAQYKITYPVAYDCEGYENAGSRQYNMTKTERTDVALAFMKQIQSRGYGAMFYSSKGELDGEVNWEVSRISSLYKVWVAQYPGEPYPATSESSYSGAHAMWQYSNQGRVPGIDGAVDVNVAYFGYEKVQDAQDEETPDQVEADEEALMKFTEVDEMVTAKDKTNLRNKPSQGGDSKVLDTLENGEKVRRTGVSESGWSRLEIDGKKYYAVSSYLTTDLDYKPPREEDDGIETDFTAVSDKVTAKEVVNLRTLPSVTHEESKVAAQLTSGEVAKRTGINKELGWSRVEYEGQVLYCITSYLNVVESE